MTQAELDEVLQKHKLWLDNDPDGEQADLSHEDLSCLKLNDAKLNDAKLNGAKLNYAELNYTELDNAKLNNAKLNGAKLNYTELNYAELNYTELDNAELNYAKLNGAKLNYAELNYAELNYAELNYTELDNANLTGAKMNHAELNGCKGLLSPINFLNDNFEKSEQGYIVYKCFSGSYSVPDYWEIKSGSIIEEEVNPNRTELCGCGINVATLDWVKDKYPNFKIYKLLIKWEWLPGVVVPYNTDGKFRCSRAMILEEVK